MTAPHAGDASMTMGDIVTDNAERFPDVVAYRLGGDGITHAALRERAVQLVSAMTAHGLRRQDRIAVMSRNSIEFGELFAATYLSGLVMATISFRWSHGEVRDALRRVTPSIVFCDGEFAPMIGELAGELPGVRVVVSLGTESWPQMTRYDDFIAQGAPGELALTAQPDDIACLLFTSGTTGASKCCILGHRELRRIAFSMNVEMRCGSDDRGLINMPMFHFGAVAIIGGLHARGATVVLQRQFDPAEAVALIAEHDVTVLHLAPVMLQTLLDTAVTGEGLETVRTIVYAAAPMTPHTLRQALRTLPKVGFLNLYGQTEATVSGLPRELHMVGDPEAERLLGSVGFPFPGVRVRIVDDDGRDVDPGLPGEILIQSNSMFRGYWNDHAATLATLRDGWCHTGDVGRLDSRGLLYLVDRKKDVIISGGENVYSPEVEEAVIELEQVKACAVVGIPDRQWGEVVCVVAVIEPGATLTLDEVQRRVRDRLARYKVPRRMFIIDELPVLASGKVDKKSLRSLVAERHLEVIHE
jgi:acyl-CoA synthetase (AMP-forming)/AMP-acid ligase II